ncbi:MAG: hypothetical protein LOD92_06385, partial [Bacillales bacterium]
MDRKNGGFSRKTLFLFCLKNLITILCARNFTYISVFFCLLTAVFSTPLFSANRKNQIKTADREREKYARPVLFSLSSQPVHLIFIPGSLS